MYYLNAPEQLRKILLLSFYATRARYIIGYFIFNKKLLLLFYAGSIILVYWLCSRLIHQCFLFAPLSPCFYNPTVTDPWWKKRAKYTVHAGFDVLSTYLGSVKKIQVILSFCDFYGCKCTVKIQKIQTP